MFDPAISEAEEEDRRPIIPLPPPPRYQQLAIVPEAALVPVGNVRQSPQLKYIFCNVSDVRNVDVIWIDGWVI